MKVMIHTLDRYQQTLPRYELVQVDGVALNEGTVMAAVRATQVGGLFPTEEDKECTIEWMEGHIECNGACAVVWGEEQDMLFTVVG